MQKTMEAQEKTTEEAAPVAPVETAQPAETPKESAPETEKAKDAPKESPKAAPAEALLGESSKKADEAPKDEAKEEDIQLSAPEGHKLDDVFLDEFKPLAKEYGLNSEKAQKLLDVYFKAQAAAAIRTSNEWLEAAKADKEVGGEKLKASAELANKALAKFGTPELRQWLGNSPLANNPELLRIFSRIGAAISNDSVAGTTGTTAATAANKEELLHRKLYPSMFAQEK